MTIAYDTEGWTGPTRVGDLMTSRPTTIGPEETLAFALELMLWGAVHHLPVVQEGKLLGIVSDRDLLSRKIAGGFRALKRHTVSEVMKTEVQTANPDDDIADAAARMAAGVINCLPVVDHDGRLVGILTSTDILAERGRLIFKSGRGTVPSAHTLMTRPPASVGPGTSIIDAVTLMLKRGVRHLPVVDEHRHVVGMLSERDLRTALGAAALSSGPSGGVDRTTVASAMSARPVVAQEQATLFDLAGHFIHERIGAVPVVDAEERLVGLVSYVDLLAYLLGGTHTPS